MASGTVTLEKSYFETLLRRAQFHTSGVDFSTPVDLSTVTIPKADHDSLLSSARQYGNLRRNLFRGGIPEETFAILIQDDPPTTEAAGTTAYSTIEETTDGGVHVKQTSAQTSNHTAPARDYTYGRNINHPSNHTDARYRDYTSRDVTNVNDDFTFMPDGPSDGFHDECSGNNDSQTRYNRPQFEKFAQRTVLLSNLPEGVTHAEVVDVVRGGMLLDIYLRSHDKAASVSFLEEANAQEFYRHVKRHDLYIRGKRVEIRWNDRQFILPPHVANKVGIGATRNLVIQNCHPKHTEEAIRNDLEHIHNLVVIKVAFNGQNAYISTNSVHNAMFARTCMMSRVTYKGSKIGWDDDECAAPLEKPNFVPPESMQPKKQAPLMNRFQLLNMDVSEDSEDDETSGITFQSTRTPSALGVVA